MTLTIVPIVKAFQQRHDITDMVVADAGMLSAAKSSDRKIKAEPVWNPETHTKSWRAVWAYSAKRAVCDNKTLNLQEAKARAVVAGDKPSRTTRFVTTRNGAQELDTASLQRARRLLGLKGYVSNIDVRLMPAAEVIASYYDLGTSSSPSGCPNPTSLPGPSSRAPATQSEPT